MPDYAELERRSPHDGDPAEVIAWLRGAPARWLISAESDLGDRLVAAGCRPERTAVVMGARLGALELGAPEGEPAAAAEYRRLGFELRPALRDRCVYLPARTPAP